MNCSTGASRLADSPACKPAMKGSVSCRRKQWKRKVKAVSYLDWPADSCRAGLQPRAIRPDLTGSTIARNTASQSHHKRNQIDDKQVD